MISIKKLAWFKSVVPLATILVLLVPASLLAWFCGTGRMTGGGKLLLCTPDNSMCVDVIGAPATNSGVTNGYELHCDGSLPNNLEINDHLGTFKFKLDILQTANCITTGPGPNPPAAGFDTFIGQGNGTWGHGGTTQPACAEWAFADYGGGQSSESYIRITDTPSTSTDFCPSQTSTSPTACPGNVLLLAPFGPLSGQNQAHK